MNSAKKHILAALTVALALSSESNAQTPDWPNPVAEQVIPYLSTGLLQGPMLGRPAATSIRVWIRTEEAMDFEIRNSTRLPLGAGSPSVKGKTLAGDDNTGFNLLNCSFHFGCGLLGSTTRIHYLFPNMLLRHPLRKERSSKKLKLSRLLFHIGTFFSKKNLHLPKLTVGDRQQSNMSVWR
jgi:hypothetical protein